MKKRKPLQDFADTALPRWKHVYPALDSAEMAADKEKLESLTKAFGDTYYESWPVHYLSGADLGTALAEYNDIITLTNKITQYIDLLHIEDSDNAAKVKDLEKWLQKLGDDVAFFELELISMDENTLIKKLSDPKASRYAPWISLVRSERGHYLGDDVETLCTSYTAANTAEWHRMYTELMDDVRVPMPGGTMKYYDADAEQQKVLLSKEEKSDIRLRIAKSLAKKGEQFSFIYNTLMQDHLADADMRKYTRPDESQNIANGLSNKAIDVMEKTLGKHYARLSHEFYRWKYAQPPEASLKEEPSYTYDETRKATLRSFRRFSPVFSRIAQKVFDQGHIDAQIRDRKDTWAYALSIAPGIVPYISINFRGGLRQATTLAHELGHAIHFYLMEKTHPALLTIHPTSLSETASTFSEMLAIDILRDEAKCPRLKQHLLEEKVTMMLNGSLRQFSYHMFERRAYEERKTGEIPAERLAEIYYETQKEYYGPAMRDHEYHKCSWMTVPHFFSEPFSVYPYAFAQTLVNALYRTWQDACKEGASAQQEFIDNFTDLLQNCGTKSIHDLIAPFDLDPEEPAFWEKSVLHIEDYITELKTCFPAEPAPEQDNARPKPPAP